MRNVQLSAREREVLRSGAHGLTTDDIANKREISERTMRLQLYAARTELVSANRQEVVAMGVQLGLFSAQL